MPSIDRLSGLPDHIICHILSFLPTMNSVATNILAKRWRFLWAHLPNLDFHSRYPHTELSILDIINRFMLLYEYRSCDNGIHCKFQLEKCFTAAMERKVKEIDLCLANFVVLPSCIFTCKTLIDLRLSNCGYIPTTEDVCLPTLKSLHLVNYEVEEALPHFLSGCPVLEELIVEGIGSLLGFFNISSPTIKRLKVDIPYDSCCLVHPNDMTYRVKIDTPALRYLKLWDTVSNNISCGPLTSLMEAEVCFNNNALVEGDVLYSRSVLELVGRLTNVKSLLITTSLLKVTQYAFSELTMKFQNLTSLTFYGDWRFISRFLENADNIEVLTIHMVNNDLNCNWMPRLVSSCVMSRLRWVKIDQFRCTMHEFNMIRYLLRNAKVLKRMEIHSQHNATDSKTNSDALKSIASFRRGSEACELVYH
ncbi:F-box/LRR-repeat protein at4g14103 [Phtheirospermum japonicum]|uniref:F-box/LRR-repeat protein at4g14103 n=1 Tax=Phtheirospermum japonicum TaxID=374723 RepID=A0A830BW61_9LAMI|nr:F-box/LRR-repeat protein at4g14103 [Phtheirospermum japonicum]